MSQDFCTAYTPEPVKLSELRAKTDQQLLKLIHSKVKLGLGDLRRLAHPTCGINCFESRVDTLRMKSVFKIVLIALFTMTGFGQSVLDSQRLTIPEPCPSVSKWISGILTYGPHFQLLRNESASDTLTFTLNLPLNKTETTQYTDARVLNYSRVRELVFTLHPVPNENRRRPKHLAGRCSVTTVATFVNKYDTALVTSGKLEAEWLEILRDGYTKNGLQLHLPFERCFLGWFSRGETVAVKVTNLSAAVDDVTVQRYSENGTLVASETRQVAGRATAEIRLSVSSEKTECGWIRVFLGSNSVSVSATFEYLDGNSLVTLPAQAGFSPAYFESNLSTTYDMNAHPELKDVMIGFVNLSDHPVHVGMCQANSEGCINSKLSNTVAQMAVTFLPVDPQKRFLVIESEPGYYVVAIVHSVDGIKQTFGADSSVTFGPVN